MPPFNISSPNTEASYTLNDTWGGEQQYVSINGAHNSHLRFIGGRLISTSPVNSTAAAIRITNSNNVILEFSGTMSQFRSFPITIDALNCDSLIIKGLKVYDGKFRGIVLNNCTNSLVEGCYIRRIWGSTIVAAPIVMGIEVLGNNNSIVNNYIQDIGDVNSREKLGISFSNANKDCVAANNVIQNKNQLPLSFGVWVGGNPEGTAGESIDVTISNNTIINFESGIVVSSPTDGFMSNNTIITTYVDPIRDSDASWEKGGNTVLFDNE